MPVARPTPATLRRWSSWCKAGLPISIRTELAAIGEAGDDAQGRLGWLTDDYFLDHCLAETKLSLFECLAVAKPNYEDAFCLGQHGMKDTGACVVRAAGGVVPLELYAHPIKLPRAHYLKRGAAKKRRHA